MGRSQRKIDARRVGVLIAALAVLGACAQPVVRQPAAQHRVRSGETLGWIAEGYGVDVDRLARANRLRDADRIEVGRRLVIPDGARIVHRARAGETLPDIAARYRVRDSTIASLNRLRSPRLTPGQKLILPLEATLPAPTPSVAAVSVAAPTARTPVPPREAAPPPARAPAPPPRPDPPSAEPDPNVARAETMVDRAVDDYRSARFERALDKATGAEVLLAQSGDTAARPLGARAAFVKGSALAALGQRERAVESFARVHALDADFEPPDGWLSPRLEQLYRTAQP
jgi:LysM repeat protein